MNPKVICASLTILVFAGCQGRFAPEDQGEYPCLKKDIDDSGFVAGKVTFAELERKSYESQYLQKLQEFDEICSKFKTQRAVTLVKADPVVLKATIKIINEQSARFKAYIQEYGKNHASHYCRNYPYHYYGSMVDLLNLGIKHIRINLAETASA
jgi:hypothetical protein